MPNPRLSRHFSHEEAECKCGCGLMNADPVLVRSLEALRVRLGRPIYVNSWCRCEKHNATVGGSKQSQHLLGKAADIRIPDVTQAEVVRVLRHIKAISDGGMGLYPDRGFIHVDVRDERVRWGEIGGKTVAFQAARHYSEANGL